jgi:AraC-like DNA-binding protein
LSLTDLALLIEQHADGRGVATSVPRQRLTREDLAPRNVDVAYRPLLCFVVGGAKTTSSAAVETRVGRGEMFLSRFDLPVLAAYEPGYRSVTLHIDEHVLAGVMAELGDVEVPASAEVGAIMKATMDDGVVSAVTRWVALLRQPELASALAPRIEQEILLRVLLGPLGIGLRRAVAGGPAAAIRQSAALLMRAVSEPVSTAALAERAGMSPATFFRHFKAATGLSPGRFQKVVRLQHARALLAAGTHNASAAAYAAGYESVSQFTRDYRHQYGAPPGRDARAMRGAQGRPEVTEAS